MSQRKFSNLNIMELSGKNKQEPSGYGYGYGGSYAGYSAVGYGDNGAGSVQRSFQDYLLILRERIWYVVVVFLVVFSSSLVYTLSQTKIYRSSATVQIFRRDPNVIQMQQVMDNDIRSAEDLNTQIKVLESASIIRRVAERLNGEDLRAFLAPYEKATADTAFVAEILAKNRKVVQNSPIPNCKYHIRSPRSVRRGENFKSIADEYLAHNTRIRIV
jgi:succinoglycan biosynthesis transport protein ExoP